MSSLGISLLGLVSAAIFLALGLVVYVLFLSPIVNAVLKSFRREIIEEKNIALALLAGFISLSLAIIIASAVH